MGLPKFRYPAASVFLLQYQVAERQGLRLVFQRVRSVQAERNFPNSGVRVPAQMQINSRGLDPWPIDYINLHPFEFGSRAVCPCRSRPGRQ